MVGFILDSTSKHWSFSIIPQRISMTVLILFSVTWILTAMTGFVLEIHFTGEEILVRIKVGLFWCRPHPKSTVDCECHCEQNDCFWSHGTLCLWYRTCRWNKIFETISGLESYVILYFWSDMTLVKRKHGRNQLSFWILIVSSQSRQ